MNNLESKRKQSSLINQKIREVGFVTVESVKEEKFKYCRKLFRNIGSTESFHKIRKNFNIVVQKIKTSLEIYDWNEIKNDSKEYLIEASIQGATIGFGLHFVFGIEFTICKVIGIGVLTKEIVNLWWRLKKDGSNKQIPKTNN